MIIFDKSKKFLFYLNKLNFYNVINEFLSFLECVSNTLITLIEKLQSILLDDIIKNEINSYVLLDC